MSIHIACEECPVRDSAACEDCIVPIVCGREPGDAVIVPVDAVRVLRRLDAHGMEPRVIGFR